MQLTVDKNISMHDNKGWLKKKMKQQTMSNSIDSAVIATGALSPAWAYYLQQFNGVLTCISLILAIALGILRLRTWFKGRKKK